MTGPAVLPPKPSTRVLTGDEWEQSQYAPHRAGHDPTTPMPGGRILTGDEWDKAQSAGSFSSLTFPALPKFAADATKRLNPNAGAPDRSVGEQLGGAVHNASTMLDAAGQMLGPMGGPLQGAAILGRQVVEPVVTHPFATGALMAAGPVGAAIGTGMAAHTIATYGWQVAHEMGMSPEDRAKAEADPNRVSGEAAAVQALMLGLGGLAGVKSIANAADVSGGMMEAGSAGLKDFRPTDATLSDYVRADKAYFESSKGAEVLGSAAAHHGLPETASPYPPDSPLAAAWQDGHASTAPKPTDITIDTSRGGIVARSPDGAVGGAVRDNTLHIASAQVAEERRGTGHGIDLYRAAIDDALAKGLNVESDNTVEAPAAHVYEALARRGYDVQRNPNTVALEDGTLYVAGSGVSEPVFTVKRAPGGMQEVGGGGTVASASEGPAYRNPASLYKRLSDDALGAEYRALIEKRTTEQPNAEAPLWTPEREAAAVEEIENRRRRDGSLTAADKRQLATLQAAQGEDYYVGRHTKESAAAERRVADMTKHITAIEHEIANRGLNADELMQPPATGEGGGLASVEGTGDLKTRGLSVSVEQRAIAKDLTDYLGDLPQYRSVNMADQAAQAAKLLVDDPELARRVALGDAPAPQGILPESVLVAAAQKALVEGDVATIRDLAGSRLTGEATTMGQRIRALRDLDSDSPLVAIRRIEDARGGGPGAAKAIDDTVAEINEHLGNVTKIEPDALAAFIDSLRC